MTGQIVVDRIQRLVGSTFEASMSGDVYTLMLGGSHRVDFKLDNAASMSDSELLEHVLDPAMNNLRGVVYRDRNLRKASA